MKKKKLLKKYNEAIRENARLNKENYYLVMELKHERGELSGEQLEWAKKTFRKFEGLGDMIGLGNP